MTPTPEPTIERLRQMYVLASTSGMPVYSRTTDEEKAIAGQAFDRAMAAHDAQVAEKVLRDARVRPVFEKGLPNDGEFEYTSSSDCDGSHRAYLRRRPRYVGEYHPWETTTHEAWAAIVRTEESEDA